MRPPERHVTLALHLLEVHATEDPISDEPYMWILGFKVDADTIDTTVLPPRFGVRAFEGAPASPFLVGPHSVEAPASVSIQPALGTRAFTLKPALALGTTWFEGLAGIVCLLFDQDAASPSISEAGQKAFNKAFPRALGEEIRKLLLEEDYDVDLSKDADGRVVAKVEPTLTWRLDRLADAAARKNAVKAITRKLKDDLTDIISGAFADAASIDEKVLLWLDRDTLLGVQAQVFMGGELEQPRTFALSFDEEGALYRGQGNASATRTRIARLDSTVTQVERRFDSIAYLTLRVCWFQRKLYQALAYRLRTVTRFTVTPTVGDAPTEVRWVIDGRALTERETTLTVQFEPMEDYTSSPQDVLAANYPGGPGELHCKVAGSVLEITSNGANGIYFGKVAAVWAYPSDPTLFPSVNVTAAELLGRGYSQEVDFDVPGVELVMGPDYVEDMRRCKRIVGDIDRKRIPTNFGKVKINPGDPPRDRRQWIEQVTADSLVGQAAGLQIVSVRQMRR